MGKYSESIKNLKEIVKTFRLEKMNEDINNMEELLKYYQQSYIEPREIAIHILEEIELYGNEYYLAEDWITDCILGNLYPMPWQLNYEYFKCYVRRFVRGVTNPDELNAEDIDNIVHNVMKNDEFFDYMNDVISQHIMEYVEEHNTYTKEELYLYSEYLKNWYKTHNEGEPACIDEWYNNEYMEEHNE